MTAGPSDGGFWAVNQAGMGEIARFLGAHHRLGFDHFTPDMIAAWAADAEFHLAEGCAPIIEISPWDSTSGHTETYIVTDAGIDWVPLP